MKNVNMLSRIKLILSFFILFSNHAFADAVCPPTAMMREVEFLYAVPLDEYKTIWQLTTDPMQYDNHQWQVKFIVTLGAKNPGDAVKKGQEFLRYSPLRPEPKKHVHSRRKFIECQYDPDSMDYHYYAITNL